MYKMVVISKLRQRHFEGIHNYPYLECNLFNAHHVQDDRNVENKGNVCVKLYEYLHYVCNKLNYPSMI